MHLGRATRTCSQLPSFFRETVTVSYAHTGQGTTLALPASWRDTYTNCIRAGCICIYMIGCSLA